MQRKISVEWWAYVCTVENLDTSHRGVLQRPVQRPDWEMPTLWLSLPSWRICLRPLVHRQSQHPLHPLLLPRWYMLNSKNLPTCLLRRMWMPCHPITVMIALLTFSRKQRSFHSYLLSVSEPELRFPGLSSREPSKGFHPSIHITGWCANLLCKQEQWFSVALYGLQSGKKGCHPESVSSALYQWAFFIDFTPPPFSQN